MSPGQAMTAVRQCKIGDVALAPAEMEELLLSLRSDVDPRRLFGVELRPDTDGMWRRVE